jgi:hypothetical protein
MHCQDAEPDYCVPAARKDEIDCCALIEHSNEPPSEIAVERELGVRESTAPVP